MNKNKGEKKMNNVSKLMKVDQDLLKVAQTGEFSKVKGYICNIYQYNSIDDKKVYSKLVKLALKVFSEQDANDYFASYLVSKINNAWQSSPSNSLDFVDLSLEIMNKLKKYNIQEENTNGRI